jgi:cobalt-zinc-cadmium efflux system outer membrane protein
MTLFRGALLPRAAVRAVLALGALLAAGCALAAPGPECAPLPAAAVGALSLPEALARVAACHPDVRAARAALAGAGADVQIAGQAPNPQLTVGAGSIGTALGNGPLWRKTYDQSVRVDQLIERGNKPALRRAAAQAARQAAEADLADAQRRAAQAVAHLHQDLWATQGRVAQLQAAVDLSTQSLQALERRVRAGDAPALDVTRFRLDDARLQADLRQAQADAADGQRQLALLIGAAEVAAQLQPLAAALPPLPERMVNATEQRADVAAAQARVSAAEQARDLAAASRTRDVTVGLQVDRWPTSATNGSGTGNTVSLSASVPLFIRHNSEGELARAEADLAAAQEALHRTRAAAQAELASAQAQARAAQDRRRLVAAELEPAAEQVAAGAELAYRRGASSALELLDARRSLRAVRIERLNADAALAKALADHQAAAGLWPLSAATAQP